MFKENTLKNVVDGVITEAILQPATAENLKEFRLKLVKIKRVIRTSVPPSILQQKSDKKT